MKNFYFYLFLLVCGGFFACGQKDSSENENADSNGKGSDSNNQTKNESDAKLHEKQVKKYNRQSFPITPDERSLINQKLLHARKPGFLENGDYISSIQIPIGGRRQKIHLTDDSGRYKVQLENFQHERPTNFQAALGAISARIINNKNEEYIPYPPNGNPYNYPEYRGHSHATEPSVIRAYERSSGFSVDAPPLMDFGQQNPGAMFASNIYQRSFPQFGNSGPSFDSGGFFSNGAPNQFRNSEQMNKWYEDQTKERIF